MTIQLALAPFVFVVGLVLMLFGNASAQRLAPAFLWLGLAFTLAEFGGRAALSLH
jgi:hypothetical protein